MDQHRTAAVVCAAALLALLAGPGGIGPGGPLAAQEAAAPAPATYQEQIDAFFARMAEGERAEAVDALYAESPLAEELGDQLEKLKAQFAELPGAVGEYLGHERIAVQPLGERFVYVWHVAYFEERPFQLHFSFYKPRDRWIILQLGFDRRKRGPGPGAAAVGGERRGLKDPLQLAGTRGAAVRQAAPYGSEHGAGTLRF